MPTVTAGALVREARTRAGLSQRALARRARTTQSVVARIEGGTTSPSWATPRRPLCPTRARHKARWVLSGAVAPRLQGFPRLTADTDITPERGGDNLKRLAAALRGGKGRGDTQCVPVTRPFEYRHR